MLENRLIHKLGVSNERERLVKLLRFPIFKESKVQGYVVPKDKFSVCTSGERLQITFSNSCPSGKLSLVLLLPRREQVVNE